jgi:hypothetical protein
MNPEIHTIIEDMKKRSPPSPLGSSDIQNYLSIQMARLLVLLSKEAEKQGAKIIYLTWAMAAMSAALLLLGIIQIVKF